MIALTELSSDELLALCDEENKLPHYSVPYRFVKTGRLLSALHVVDGHLIRISGRLSRNAVVVNDSYSQDAMWLWEQGYGWLGGGYFRYTVDAGGDLCLKAGLRELGEYQILEELTKEFPFPTVAQVEYELPSGNIASLQERLTNCDRFEWAIGHRPFHKLPPIPAWVRHLGDGGQVGWSEKQEQWVAFDFNDVRKQHKYTRVNRGRLNLA